MRYDNIIDLPHPVLKNHYPMSLYNRAAQFAPFAALAGYEKSLMLMERKIKKVNTKPLIEPLNRWDELTVEEKNQLAMLMIDKIYLSNEKGVEIRFSF